MRFRFTTNIIGGSTILETENADEALSFAVTRDCRMYRDNENVAVIIPDGDSVYCRRDVERFPTFVSLFT